MDSSRNDEHADHIPLYPFCPCSIGTLISIGTAWIINTSRNRSRQLVKRDCRQHYAPIPFPRPYRGLAILHWTREPCPLGRRSLFGFPYCISQAIVSSWADSRSDKDLDRDQCGSPGPGFHSAIRNGKPLQSCVHFGTRQGERLL